MATWWSIQSNRKLEDKFQNHKIELRPFTINLNLEELHRNRELPGAFLSFLGVCDATLPLRGTAHRVVRGAPDLEAETNASLVYMILIWTYSWNCHKLNIYDQNLPIKDSSNTSHAIPGQVLCKHLVASPSSPRVSCCDRWEGLLCPRGHPLKSLRKTKPYWSARN